MELEKCYEAFGGSYQNVKSRLTKDELIQRLVIKFLSDTSYETLFRAMGEKDYGEAFRMAHTLKGICLNLSFDRLAKSSSELTEALRNYENEPTDEENCRHLLQKISEDYETVRNAITELKESAEANK